MNTSVAAALCCLLISLFALSALADPLDVEGCMDPPSFNRMPGYIINNCEINDFNGFDFPMAGDETTIQRAEGKFWKVDYHFNEGKAASYVGLLHNFKNAIEHAGGKALYLDDKDWMRLTGKIVKGGGETWVHVAARDDGAGYTLVVVEKEAMKQEITSGVMMDSLNASGHIALAINFDTGKSTIKEESQPIIAQMVELLKMNAELKVEIEGHTDNVGEAKANLKLSQERAAAVKQALVGKGIDAGRMSTAGFGDTKPVADNKSDEGRAKNRRVELVKK